MTSDAELRLVKYFGTRPQFWMNLQAQFDLEVAEDDNAEALKWIKPIRSRAAYRDGPNERSDMRGTELGCSLPHPSIQARPLRCMHDRPSANCAQHRIFSFGKYSVTQSAAAWRGKDQHRFDDFG